MKRAPTTSRRRRLQPSPGAVKFSPVAADFIAAAVADGLAIQHRFKAEPVYARTGKGFMSPSGVAEIAVAKLASKTSHSKR